MLEFPNAASWVTEQRLDHSTELESIRIPTCLIWGDADPISPLAIGQALAAGLPSSILHVIKEGTHMLARSDPTRSRR